MKIVVFGDAAVRAQDIRSIARHLHRVPGLVCDRKCSYQTEIVYALVEGIATIITSVPVQDAIGAWKAIYHSED